MVRNDSEISVLHLAGRLNRGGIETWLLKVLQAAQDTNIKRDVLVVTNLPGELDDAVRETGSHLFVTNRPLNPLGQLYDLRKIHQMSGPYNIVHSHVQPGGIQLRLAHHCGIPVRIAHSHTTELMAPAVRLHQKLVARLTAHWVRRYATAGLACSEAAAATLFGPNWRDDPRWQVLHYGIDLAPFRKTSDRRWEVRRSFGIPHDAFVIGHVGRMSPEKNHRFLVTLAREIAVQLPGAYFVLVGDGPLRPQVEAWIRRAGLTDRVRLLGSRGDVPVLMTHLFDLFLFPSLYEGLPITIIEAQAAGIPIVASEAVPMEAVVVPQLILRLSLKESISQWVKAVMDMRRRASFVAQEDALSLLERSDFNIHVCTAKLFRLYEEMIRRTLPTGQLSFEQ
jgi:glycosyltransferase involved in cell wall biosynthesis